MKVSVWLEQLHDRRVEATRTQDLVVQKLNRKIKSLDAALLIDEYGKMIQSIRDNINNINDVGQNIEECREQIASLSTFESHLILVRSLGKSQGNNFPYFDGTHAIFLLLLYTDVYLFILVLNILNF